VSNTAELERLNDSVPATAQRLGICQAFVWKLIKDGKITPVKIGRRTLIPRVEQVRFIETLMSAA
jgi:excisionase family DNA binding protein